MRLPISRRSLTFMLLVIALSGLIGWIFSAVINLSADLHTERAFARQQAAAVLALREQVRSLGGTPIAPGPSPIIVPGEPGRDGRDGRPGPAGSPGSQPSRSPARQGRTVSPDSQGPQGAPVLRAAPDPQARLAVPGQRAAQARRRCSALPTPTPRRIHLHDPQPHPSPA
jgi:hypothetical protein